jgi:hypothetical protein
MRWIPLIAFVSLPLLTEGQTVRLLDEAPMSFGVQPHLNRFITWKGDSLSFVPEHGKSPTIRLMNRQGREEPPIAFALPGATDFWLEDAARSLDGGTVVVGSASFSGSEQRGFLTLIPASGRWSTVQLQPYHPYRVSFASDGTIWTLGANDNNDKGALVRQFDSGGKLISSHVPMNAVSKLPGFDFVDVYMESLFATAQGRVGWYAPRTGRYFELSSDGALTQYDGVPNDLKQANALALTDSGTTIVSCGGTDGYYQLWSLDRAKKEWIRLDLSAYGPSGFSPLLYGASGDTIAVTVKVGDIAFFEVR